MLNQYYEFLSNNLIKWLSKRDSLQLGDKYFILLDSEEDMTYFYRTLKHLVFENKEIFTSREFGYETVAYTKDGTRILFVAPVDNITQDFLVTIRNKVNANQAEWENTAVVFIVNDPLDSIMGGSYDLSQKGAPFHSQTIQQEVEREIKKSSMSLGQKAVLDNYLAEITAQTSTVLKDYETLFSVLENETIKNDDFNAMGYFPDEHLDTFDSKTIESRLKENSDLYLEVEKMHEFFDVTDRLENRLEGVGLIKRLEDKDGWRDTEFTEIKAGVERFEKLKKIDIEIDYEKIKEVNESLWFRLGGTTKAQRRKGHLLLSTKNIKNSQLTIDIPFDTKILRSYVTDAHTYVYEAHGVEHTEVNYQINDKTLSLNIEGIDPAKTYGGKISYKHYGKSNLNFVITFMLVPFSLRKIEKLRSDFEITVIGTQRTRSYYFGMTNDLQKYRFGTGKEKLIIDNPEELVTQDLANRTIELSGQFSGETRDDLRVQSNLENFPFPIEFLDIDYRSIPSTAMNIEARRLGEKEEQFIYRDNKIAVGSSSISVEKNYQEWLNLEEEMVRQKSLYGHRSGYEYEPVNLVLTEKVQAAYNQLFNYYQKEETLPSLAIFNDEHITLLKEITEVVREELENHLKEDHSTAEEIRNISKIGLVENRESFDMSPLSPILIGYQIELYYQLKESDEVPKGNVLRTLNAENLIPYFKIKNQSYQSNYTSAYPRWLFYETLEDRKLSDLSSNIINQRLDDYLTQYNFLFKTNPEMHLNIAGINIVDEYTFFDAMINFMIDRMEETISFEEINPINIYVNRLGNSLNSLFHELYAVSTIEELNNHLKENIATKIYDNRGREYSEYEVIETLQEKINIYKLPVDYDQESTDLFFHVTLYQFSQEDKLNVANMKNLTKNYSMSGLLSSSEFVLDNQHYINGFGLGVEDDSSIFISDVSLWNSFMASLNQDTDIYQPEYTWVNYISKINDSRLDHLFDSSHWVTFLNLDVDLSYFYEEKERDLLVIHYTDQSTSNQYESITVTNDTRQYDSLLENAIAEYSETIDTHEIIRNFNVINGQWLLKLISDQEKNRGNRNIFREKLSIISAYKELLGILDHPNFHWIPISLEEILRVSGMVGFSKKDGLFSTQNLGESGRTSDDLLMMGIEQTEDGQINIHFLPVEVKVGINSASVRKKAVEQLEKTYSILSDYLTINNEDPFMREYYLNFFISLMLANLEKMVSSGIYSVEEISNYNVLKDALKVGYYNVSDDLLHEYGKGIIFEFTKDTSARTAIRLSESNISLIKVPEADAYNIVSEDTREIIEKISMGQFDFEESILLKNRMGTELNEEDSKAVDPPAEHVLDSKETDEMTASTETVETIEQNKPERPKEQTKVTEPEKKVVVVEPEIIKRPEVTVQELEDKRLLIGQVLNSNHQVYWEYGNKNLSNRHMLITGKSGQGKTYFIQTLLAELSESNLSSLIIDYTDGFLHDQLEPMLREEYTNQLKNKFIYQDKLPLNPFEIQPLDFGGHIMDEQPRDMVDRVVQIIDFVFNLGIQQRTLLSEVILEGYRVNKASYTFTHLKEDLMTSEDKDKERLYGRISTLLARDPFSYDAAFSWGDIFNNKGEIHILQLKGFQRNIQQVMIEFMLWDLFQYATKTGSEEKPLPIILDEIQNLNFDPNSPTVKILREGRKFGLSGIFATQSLDSIVGQDSEAIYNAAQQIHFLPPDSQVKNIARQISSTTKEVREIESEFKKLHKGEAIVYGPMRRNDGTLTPSQRHNTSISSFEERLKE